MLKVSGSASLLDPDSVHLYRQSVFLRLKPPIRSPDLLSADAAMLPEAPIGCEAAAADVAAERFVSAVDQLMRLQVVVLTEPFPADVAFERFLAAVDAFVSDEVL